MIGRNLFRVIPVLAVLLAGSCAGPDDVPALTQDPVTNHPISVEPSYRSLKLAYAASLSHDDNAKLVAFVEDYLSRGNGAISISVPAGPDSTRAIDELGEELVSLGVPRAHILVGQQDAADGRIELGFIGYEARTAPCGDWSANAADTADNLPMPNFGCAVQQNIAAQVADPRDLVQPRGLGPADAARRTQVLNKYEQGVPTTSQKTPAQSAAVSDVGTGQKQ